MKRAVISTSAFVLLLFTGCLAPDPNVDETGKDQLKSLELDHKMKKSDMIFEDLIYVPIYAEMYVDAEFPKVSLTATLSIRNTSYEDSIFISKIDYFDTDGSLVRSYLTNPISLPPMASINEVVERGDDTGGHGANFIIALSAKSKDVRPVVQAVMIGDYSNKGFSFSTDGYSIMPDSLRTN